MEPLDRKKRIIIALAGMVIALVIMGSFFWPVLKRLHDAQPSGSHGANVPLLIFGGFFLVMVVTMVASVTRGLRQLQNPVSAAVPRAAAPAGGASLFLFFFALLWSGIVLVFDGFMGHGIYKQMESRAYPTVTGAITHSEVASHRGSKGGTSYSAVIEYAFAVGDQKLVGNKIRFGLTSSSYASASAIVSDHPVGSAVPVFYNPANPQESLLSPGIKGSDFMGLLFLTPFNMVMFGFWIWVGGWLRERLFRPPAGGVKIITDAMTTRIRLPQFPAAGWGLAATGGLGFISIFIVGFSTNMEPSMPVALSVLAAVYGTGLAIYLWQRQKINSGIDDLLINETSRTLELPLTFGRKERITVSAANIKSLSVEQIIHRSNKGGISYTYAPTLTLSGPDAGSQKLADWSDKFKADEFTEWLRPQLGPNVSATLAAAEVVDEADESTATATLQTPVEEFHLDEHSKIQITAGPNGREFYFPAARNLGTAFGLTLFWLVWTGFLWFMLRQHDVPLLFPIVFGVVDVLVFLACLNLWFKSSRVTINSTGVTAVNRWLIFSRTRQFDASNIARFDTKPGMQSGSKIYQSLTLITLDSAERFAVKQQNFQTTPQLPPMAPGMNIPSGVTLASGLASQPEADWLAREMTRALGRQP